MTDWNFNMAEAPRGQRFGDKKQYFRPDWILVSVVDKGIPRVIPVHFVEPTKSHPSGRWAGISGKQQPYAWQPFPDVADTDYIDPIGDEAPAAPATDIQPKEDW